MSREEIGNAIEATGRYLADHPDEARAMDGGVTAVLEHDLRCRVTGVKKPFELVTDMPKALGGGGTAPSPGWLSRPALASCETVMIAMRAAQLGIELGDLEVTVDSESDDRGMLGVGDGISAGPLQVRVTIKVGAEGVSRERLAELVKWAEDHSPVGDAIRRAIPTSVEVQVVEAATAD